ncbi:hypothetical protein [Candidatus Palauibacter sp.]|uniref:hypothetical protein n=1 Tax=Candidatus Palauibacter sp. TaxID=3101350 RepID=UPI003AF25430
MAVDLAALKDALKVSGGDDDTRLTRILGAADALIEKLARSAPESIRDEAKIRVAAYMYDAPVAGTVGTANACRNSGAELLLRPWVRRGALVVGAG